MPFTFISLSPLHFLLLFNWFQQDYIAQLWVEPKDWQTFEQTWQKKIAEPEVFRFLACIDQTPVGYIQYFRVNDTDRAHFPGVDLPDHSVGMDLFIGDPQLLGKGYGTELLKDFIEFLKKIEPACNTIIIDPAPDNIRAIKCYEKVGFHTIGTFVTPYGPRGDGAGEILLMMMRL